jgi:hypothetical protein
MKPALALLFSLLPAVAQPPREQKVKLGAADFQAVVVSITGSLEGDDFDRQVWPTSII